MISVLILTLDEEENIARCLDAVKWSDDVVVLDSFSTDRTAAIAREHGARVYERRFDNEREHRTYSIRELSFKYPWVYNPDADEVCTPELHNEMLAVIQDPAKSHDAYRVRFKNMFMGRWIRRSSLYPTWVIRLFKPQRLSFERSTNLRYVVEGSVGELTSHFLHYSFTNGFNAWFTKHNKYSWHEAEETIAELKSGGIDWAGLIALGDSVRRRRALKLLSMRLPLRHLLRFVYMYFLRGGFLDGHAGLHYCRLLAIYEYMIELKVREIRFGREKL